MKYHFEFLDIFTLSRCVLDMIIYTMLTFYGLRENKKTVLSQGNRLISDPVLYEAAKRTFSLPV